MTPQEYAFYRGAMIIQYGTYGATEHFAKAARLSISTVNRILRGESQLTDERRERWHKLLGISRKGNAASVLVCWQKRQAPGVRLKPGAGGLGT